MWKKVNDGVTPAWYEDVTFAAAVDVSSSVIDFLPSGTTFTVVYNTGAVATNGAACDVAIDGAIDKDDTFVEIKADLIANTSSATTAAASYIPATTGVGMPLYKVRLDPDADCGTGSVRIAVIPVSLNAADSSSMGPGDFGGIGKDPS